MKVLYITPFFAPDFGGIETLSAHLIDSLALHGHQFMIFTMHGSQPMPDVARYGDSAVYRFPYIRQIQADNLRQVHAIHQQLRQLKGRFRPDLVHIHLGNPMPIAYFHLQTQATDPTPTLLTLHNCFHGYPTNDNNALVKLLRLSDWVTAGSGAILEGALAVVPETIQRASLLLNCLPVPPASPTAPPATPHLLCIGRLVQHKGFDLAIDAFAQLLPRYPHLRMTIVGDGPARAELQQQVAALQVAENITFVGALSPAEVKPYITAATLVLIPSRWREPFCLVALEVAHMARPVIATNIGGLSEVIVDGETGLLVENENPTAIAAAITVLLEDPSKAQQMGAMARQRAETHFAWQPYVNTYDTLYKKLQTNHDD